MLDAAQQISAEDRAVVFISPPQPSPLSTEEREQAPSPRRHGIIFITTMWVILILGALVLIFARSMRVEVVASSNHLSEVQASTIELGAEQYVLSAVDACNGDSSAVLQTPGEQLQLGDGYFWIMQANATDDYSYAFGITDESSKLNLNVAASAELAILPGVSQDIADSIVNWRGATSGAANQGADSNYYQTLARPYSAKASPFETVEELYLVKDVNDAILWGYDLDHNGMIDGKEKSSGGLATAFNAASDSGRGIFPFTTVWGTEPNLDLTGKARVNISNLNNPPALHDLLVKKLSQARADQILPRAMQTRNFKNLFDFAFKTGMKSAELDKLADSLTTSGAKTLSGLVNVNTSPVQVLMCLGLTQTEAEAVIAQRPTSTGSGTLGAVGSVLGVGSTASLTGSSPTNIGWLMDTLKPGRAAAIGSRVTGRSYFYSADIVSASGDGRAFKRVRIVVDARTSPPIIVYRKDLTHLGWPLLPEIRTALKKSEPLPATTGLGTGGATGLSQL